MTNLINVYAVDSDYNELPTGNIEMTASQYISAHKKSIDNVGQNKDGQYVIICEWGNGEGSDTYIIETIECDEPIESFYMLDDDDWANETQYAATGEDVKLEWAHYQTEFDLENSQYDEFISAWYLIDADEVIVNREAFERAIERGLIYDERIVAFIQSVFNAWDELSAIMTAGEVVEEYGMSEAAVRVAISREQIKARKSGGTWLLRRVDVIKKWGNPES